MFGIQILNFQLRESCIDNVGPPTSILWPAIRYPKVDCCAISAAKSRDICQDKFLQGHRDICSKVSQTDCNFLSEEGDNQGAPVWFVWLSSTPRFMSVIKTEIQIFTSPWVHVHHLGRANGDLKFGIRRFCYGVPRLQLRICCYYINEASTLRWNLFDLAFLSEKNISLRSSTFVCTVVVCSMTIVLYGVESCCVHTMLGGATRSALMEGFTTV